VVDAHEGDFEELVARELAECREAVDAGAVGEDGLFVLCFLQAVLPFERVRGPGGDVLVVEEKDVEIVGVDDGPELVDLVLRVGVGRVVTLDMRR
jgi:hypothetical protein